MNFLSVCSGIEAASVAWEPLGFTPIGFAEIDKAASRVLAHRFGSNMPGEPLAKNGVPNHGDFTAIDLSLVPPVDVLIGGTPCQPFSIAGKRFSLADARGNLTFTYVALAHDLARSHGLKIAVWENVPGVLNTPDNAFGCFLGGLVGTNEALPAPGGKRWPDAGLVAGPRARAAWRILDAQYFGLPQRRRRVFVVVSFGEIDPAAVLFERQSLRGHSAPRRKAGEEVAGSLSASAGGCDENDARDGRLIAGTLGANGRAAGSATQQDAEAGLLVAFGGNRSGAREVATAIHAHGGPAGRLDFDSETFVVAPALTSNPYGDHEGREGLLIAHSLRGEGFDASEDGTGRGTPLIPVLSSSALRSDQPIAFDTTQITSATNRSDPQMGDPCHPLAASAHAPAIAFDARQRDVCISGDIAAPLDTDAFSQAVAFDLRGRDGGAQFEGPHDTANIRAASGGSSRSYAAVPILESGKRTGSSSVDRKAGDGIGVAGDPMFTVGADSRHAVATRWAVRRLTPTECERLQGFPDGWTAIPDGKGGVQADGPRYRQIGNAMAVPVIRWIGLRILLAASA